MYVIQTQDIYHSGQKFTTEIGNSLGVTITWYKNSFRKISCKGVICYASDTEWLGER